MENKNFRKLIRVFHSERSFGQYLETMELDFNIKLYRLGELNEKVIVELYQLLQKKFYQNRRTAKEQSWFENELRLFIWSLFAYLFLFQKSLNELKQEDWSFFSEIFNHKSTVFFEFQAKSFLRVTGRPVWCEEEIQMLLRIIKQRKYTNQWNSIARDLFTNSSKQYYRSPKQCRQKWMNHLDPSKIRTEWTPAEDLTLLSVIKKKGKKWSLVAKQLKMTRTEHMVKNRYKSMIANEMKKYPDRKESEIESCLIKRLLKLQGKVKNETERERSNNFRTNLLKVQQISTPIITQLQNPNKTQEIKIQEQDLKLQLQEQPIFTSNGERYEYYSQYMKPTSPFLINWKEENQNMQINFLEDDFIDLEAPLYSFQSSGGQHFLEI